MEERKSIFQQWRVELLEEVDTWSQSLEDRAFKTCGQCESTVYLRDWNEKEMHLFVLNVFPPVSELIMKVIQLIKKWEWGTTRNHLYQHKGEKTDLLSNSKKEVE